MCHVTSIQVFIVGSPLESILNATFDDDCQRFLLSPLYVANNIHKDQKKFRQICTSKKNKNCIILLHTSGIFAKCAILSFIWWKIVQHFKKQKKSPALKKKNKFQKFLQPSIFTIDFQFGDFAKIQKQGMKRSQEMEQDVGLGMTSWTTLMSPEKL